MSETAAPQNTGAATCVDTGVETKKNTGAVTGEESDEDPDGDAYIYAIPVDKIGEGYRG